MTRKTPQEKKRLSYAKDRRNDYGENDKSSHNNIPRNKRFPHRANRHRTQTILTDVTGHPDAVLADSAEQRLLGSRPKSWRNGPICRWGSTSKSRFAYGHAGNRRRQCAPHSEVTQQDRLA